MKCGIIGLPNAGKSTLFKALTSIQVAAENYPFCTIEPNIGTVKVPDDRIEKLATMFKSESVIYPIIEFADIAGLIKGAHKGEGLGHKFLSHIRESNALIHVVRCFEEKNVAHVCEDINPIRDIEIIDAELLLADLDTLQSRLEKTERLAKSNKELAKEVILLKKLFQFLNEENKACEFTDFKKEEAYILDSLHLLTMKSTLYVCNVGESKSDNLFVEQVRKKLGEESIIVLSGKLESDIASLEPEDQKEFLKELNIDQPALDRFVVKSFALLNLSTFFTAGKEETRGWTIKLGSSAPEAAGAIHSDFQKGFIKAEIYSAEDLFKLGSLAAIKEKGLYRIEGKTYAMKDGDVAFFRFNV